MTIGLTTPGFRWPGGPASRGGGAGDGRHAPSLGSSISAELDGSLPHTQNSRLWAGSPSVSGMSDPVEPAGPNYGQAQPVSLRNHPTLTEKWLQQRIVEDPALLGLGEVEVKDVERVQPRAGRLDLLLYDPESDTRYEVELQLGPTDESHIIRTIEYWDLERRRFPRYEHVGVIVAEDITARFFNVISLFNGFIPLVAIQVSALEVNGALTFVSRRCSTRSSSRSRRMRNARSRATAPLGSQGLSSDRGDDDRLLQLVHEVRATRTTELQQALHRSDGRRCCIELHHLPTKEAACCDRGTRPS